MRERLNRFVLLRPDALLPRWIREGRHIDAALTQPETSRQARASVRAAAPRAHSDDARFGVGEWSLEIGRGRGGSCLSHSHRTQCAAAQSVGDASCTTAIRDHWKGGVGYPLRPLALDAWGRPGGRMGERAGGRAGTRMGVWAGARVGAFRGAVARRRVDPHGLRLRLRSDSFLATRCRAAASQIARPCGLVRGRHTDEGDARRCTHDDGDRERTGYGSEHELPVARHMSRKRQSRPNLRQSPAHFRLI